MTASTSGLKTIELATFLQNPQAAIDLVRSDGQAQAVLDVNGNVQAVLAPPEDYSHGELSDQDIESINRGIAEAAAGLAIPLEIASAQMRDSLQAMAAAGKFASI
jgi:PHD/YefM family antitoxin component YafN of YafNO toxin-antitoxin module